MKSKMLVAAVILGIMVAGAVGLSAQQPGGDLFKAKCAMCHGADAAGKTPMGAKLNIPDLRTVQKQPAATIQQTITKGKNKMPAFDGKLSAQQISDLASYIQQLK